MASAVARAQTVVQKVKSAPVDRKPRARGRTKRKIKARASLLSQAMLFAIALALPFAYTTIYAKLTATGYSISDYQVLRWKEQVENERLKVLRDRSASYSRIKAGALKLGMVRASKFEYLDQPQTIARR
jgi:hypothetical protein